MSVGLNLRKIRSEQQHTQAEVAAAAGVLQAHISNIENGGKSPSIEVAILIANFLGVSLDDLFRPETPNTEAEPQS